MSLLSFFPQHIQQQIETTTTALNRLQGYWPEGISLGHNNKATIYDGYPYLFLSAFPSLTPSGVRSFSLAERLLAHSLVVYDDFIDGMSLATNALGAQAMQFEVYHLMYQLFPPDTSFWKRFRNYMAEYANACLQEQRFASGERPWQEYTEALAFEIAVGKTGVAKVTIAGLAELAGDDSLFEPLAESIHQYYIGRQMWDDLCDWKEDLQTGIPSLLLSRVFNERPAQENQEALINHLAREIYYGGHARYVLELALKSFDRADSLVADIPDLLWRRVIAELRRQCETLLDDINRIVHHNLQRVHEQPEFTLTLPIAQSQWQQLAWDALRFIVRQWRLGFGEARHVLYLTRNEGTSRATQECHYGDVFQRALIADALCDADHLIHGHLQPVISYEADYLQSRRLTFGVGGWNYFPTVPELPPDADDLGQVMQVLLRAGRQEEVVEHCEKPLTVLLNNRVRPDGSFETWIVPATGIPLAEWAAGPDNEVMANLLYALTLYDPARFAEPIQRGVTYLESQQEADGSWASKWYYGPYYGTFVCLRLSAVARPNSPAINRALDFLWQSQHSDGGWGLDDTSDPLSTSLALLSLASVHEHSSTGDLDRVEQALVYLQHSQEPNKSWPSTQFIRPRTSEPYSSRTITNVYVLKAAVAWHRLTFETPREQKVTQSVKAETERALALAF